MKRLITLILAATVICSAAVAQKTSVSLLYDGHYWSDVITHQPEGWELRNVFGQDWFDVPVFLLGGVGEAGAMGGIGGYLPVRVADNATFNVGLSFSIDDGRKFHTGLFVGFGFTAGG